MSIRDVRVATRAGVGFALLALLVLLVGSFSLMQMGKLHSQGEYINQTVMPSLASINTISTDILRVRALTLRLMIQRDPSQQQQAIRTLDELKGHLHDSERKYESLLEADNERAMFQRLMNAQRAYMSEQQRIVELVPQGRHDEALAVANGPLNQHADDLFRALNELTQFNNDNAAAAQKQSEAIYQSAFNLVVAIIVAAIALTILLAVLLTNSIVQPLRKAVGVAQVVAKGDLSQSIQLEGNDELTSLMRALQDMQQSLRSTIQQIADSSTQLASASEELHAVTEDSTRGMHQQNNELEQAATAVNEMTAAVDEVARNAVSTSQASQASSKTAEQGRDQVLRTVDSIDSLAEDVTQTAGQVEQLADKVRDISKVLDVIRAIAEQTNLLALNAAIEAARAGEQGRGFAVVADEVRLLAQRTQQSTQEIEQMIGGIQQGTDQAVNAMRHSNERARTTLDVARAAGEALDLIARSITEINERNLLIASASEEQASVAREVDRNLVNIRDLSLQTSAGANQTSASSQELSRLAVELNSMVSRFRL
ncbi:methyl-accepting chemotaxis protein [Pseudomonas fluvialis]|uniref:Methyl-accepting chemotaxis protein n=1 Tax=Pseudomonas fluvialis TaxID=1793966 RepID=A0A2I0CQV1_9PSED|nr:MULTISPECIES: methyl-accepting chemotaxis protein [Pseudomonas]OXM40583.1 methyl-accepting chemotaxis protein [Pseudomonas fluvialis]PKF71518.1 methyl-accepting chemotaxis protein [Pseudomonas pharmacofabricae]GGH89116.1 methyl-accepting chemotaxis protein [Pseudomonas fluvialis]